ISKVTTFTVSPQALAERIAQPTEEPLIGVVLEQRFHTDDSAATLIVVDENPICVWVATDRVVIVLVVTFYGKFDLLRKTLLYSHRIVHRLVGSDARSSKDCIRLLKLRRL